MNCKLYSYVSVCETGSSLPSIISIYIFKNLLRNYISSVQEILLLVEINFYAKVFNLMLCKILFHDFHTFCLFSSTLFFVCFVYGLELLWKVRFLVDQLRHLCRVLCFSVTSFVLCSYSFIFLSDCLVCI